MSDQLLIALGVAGGISLVSYFSRLLTGGGAFTQFILGSFLFGLGGWKWVVPILVFFSLSSLFSLRGRHRRHDALSFFAKTDRRDAAQVLANGGAATLALVLNSVVEWDVWYVIHLGAVAAATSDTWGTELGTLGSRFPRMITTLQPAEAGRSGAVSMQGLVVGLVGSVAIWASGLPWLTGHAFYQVFFSVVAGGMGGSLIDSLLGATLQAQYRCTKCGKLTERLEHCGGSTEHERGLSLLDNDKVNLACTLTGAITTGIVYVYLNQ